MIATSLEETVITAEINLSEELAWPCVRSLRARR
jgi:hypothetical protein